MMASQFALFDITPTVDGIDAVKLEKSYSADVIGMQSKVRNPVAYGGGLWVCVGSGGTRDDRTLSAYQLVTREAFVGESYSYSDRAAYWPDGFEFPGDFARRDPNGFYHGVTVKSGASAFVLQGPPVIVAAAPYMTVDAIDDEDADDDGGFYDDIDDDGRTLFGNTPDDADEDEDAA